VAPAGPAAANGSALAAPCAPEQQQLRAEGTPVAIAAPCRLQPPLQSLESDARGIVPDCASRRAVPAPPAAPWSFAGDPVKHRLRHAGRRGRPRGARSSTVEPQPAATGGIPATPVAQRRGAPTAASCAEYSERF